MEALARPLLVVSAGRPDERGALCVDVVRGAVVADWEGPVVSDCASEMVLLRCLCVLLVGSAAEEELSALPSVSMILFTVPGMDVAASESPFSFEPPPLVAR